MYGTYSANVEFILFFVVCNMISGSFICLLYPFATRNFKYLHYGSEVISYLGPKIWDLLPKTSKIQKILTFSN